MSHATLYLNGRLEVLTIAEEMRMSHWIYAPKIIDRQSGAVLLDLSGDLWDLVAVKESPNAITLIMRKYPGTAPQAELVISPGQTGGVFNGQTLDLNALMAALAAYS